MIPTIFEIGRFKLHSFGLMMALAFYVTITMCAREFRRRGINVDHAYEIGLGAMIGGVLGAKIYYLADHWSEFMADPRGMILSFGAGLTWYGGFIGGLIGTLATARWRGVKLIELCDISAPLLALGYAIGRVGCLLNGDDYGRPSDLPWAMSFPKGSPPTTTRVQPTQLYEIVGGVILFAFLTYLKRRVTRPGVLFGAYLILAGIERFLVEYARTNEPVALGFTFAQWISVGLVVIGAVLVARRPALNARPA